MRRLSKPVWLRAALLVVATVLAYQPVWHGGFLWDDDMHITKNRMLVRAEGWKQIWSSPDSPQYYPMVFSSFRLERALWGLKPTGYHLVNLLLHGASAVWLWQILRRLKVPGAWFAAAVFALHPINVESAAWLSQRKNTLAMFFYLLSALCYVRFDPDPRAPPGKLQWRWYGLSLAVFMLALLSKTAVSPYPVVLLGLAWWRRGTVTARDVWRSAPFFIASVVLSLITIWFERHQTGMYVIREDSFWSRLAVAGWAIWFYLSKAWWPVNLTLIYPRWQCDPSQVLAYVPIALVFGGLLLLWWKRRRWGWVWLFGAGYYVVMLLPILGFVNIGFMHYSLVADHWQYFAIIAPIAALAAGLATLFKLAGRPLAPAGWVLAGALLLTLGALTRRQSARYASAETLWRSTIAANPACWAAYYNLGCVLTKEDRPDEAILDYQKALQLKPDAVEVENNLLSALLRTGKLDEVIARYRTVLQSYPTYAEAHNNLASALLEKGAVDEAVAECQEALRLKPDYPEARNNLGIALVQQGKPEQAIAQYQIALQAEPDSPDTHNNLGTAFAQMGKMAEARFQYQEALRLQPLDPMTQNNLALLLATCREASLRNGPEAIELAQQANQSADGKNPLFLRTLAAAFAETGQFTNAVQTAQAAIQLAQAAGNRDLTLRLSNDLQRYQATLPLRP